MRVIKADNYQTWYIENQNQAILIDPWLTKTLKPDGSFFIQRKKNSISCLSEADLKIVKALIITAPFEDHLHPDSIKQFSNDLPIYTSKIVKKYIRKHKITNPINILTEEETLVCNMNIKALPTSYPYYSSTFSLLIRDNKNNTIFHEGHRVNFKYLIEHDIKADLSILTAEETKLFGIVQLGMNYQSTLKAIRILDSNELFITGNKPNHTMGFIKNFLVTKSPNIDILKREVNLYMNEGDSFNFK